MTNPLHPTNACRAFCRRHHGSVPVVAVLLALVSGCSPSSSRSATADQTNPSSRSLSQPEERVYQVGRKIRDFPEKPDLSTPETAVAALNRAVVHGESTRPFTVKEVPASSGGRPLAAAYAKKWLSQEILEVHIHSGKRAAVYRWDPGFWGAYFNASFLELRHGKWLRASGTEPPGIHLARAAFTNWCRYREQEDARRALVKDPESHLQLFVNFLRAKGEDPQTFILKALAEHPVVIMGEVHHRPQYWAFNASLVKAADFSRHVGVIYLELPGSQQPLMDRFLASPQLDTQPVISMLRDMLWTGWPDQPMLDFFISVWKVNHSLPSEKKVRIVLVDPRWDWKHARSRNDAMKGELYRDRKMANAILRDLQAHRHDSRHGLFIVGLLHAALDVTHCDGRHMESAGRMLRHELGPNAVFAIHQHRPVRFSGSEGLQRPALGLFDSAFSALQHRQIAFPLAHSPFGQVPLDEFLDAPLYSFSRYQDAFSAYLYLGPLEQEIFSPLIPGFYTDAFVREVERRHRLLFGDGLVKGAGLSRLDGVSLTEWMSRTWGQPRTEWSASRLGPITRWHQGLPEGSPQP